LWKANWVVLFDSQIPTRDTVKEYDPVGLFDRQSLTNGVPALSEATKKTEILSSAFLNNLKLCTSVTESKIV
jgi:hypothetical protein